MLASLAAAVCGCSMHTVKRQDDHSALSCATDKAVVFRRDRRHRTGPHFAGHKSCVCGRLGSRLLIALLSEGGGMARTGSPRGRITDVGLNRFAVGGRPMF